jgi:hypothetical protein
MNAGVNAFTALPGVPLASNPALQDARDSPSVPMGPSTLMLVAERQFKEGFKQGREHFASSYVPTCGDSIEHVNSCPICSSYVNSDKKILQVVIGFLVMIILVLLFFLVKKGRATSSDE